MDIRVGSPTFGQYDSVLLDDEILAAPSTSLRVSPPKCSSALEDDSTVGLHVFGQYAPGREHGVNPLCTTIAIPYPKE